MEHASPVFIHSLFRSGSTYLFNVFRRSESKYWCYQEPLNEKLLFNATKPGGFKVGIEGLGKILRHPELDKPYCFEFHVVENQFTSLFKKEFSYQQYFLNSTDELKDLTNYFSTLLQNSQGRAVFQCCRTTGRVEALKQSFEGVHIFLWRNPWDQWWSYKQDHYFDSRNLFIFEADKLPRLLQTIKNELKIPSLQKANPANKDAYLNNRRLTSQASYILFYALWCHAQLEAKPKCNISINIDDLSLSDEYRKNTLTALKSHGIEGLDFSDSAVAIAAYGESDAEFFKPCENFVHELLLKHGFSEESVDTLKELASNRYDNLANTSLVENSAIRDAMRAREYSRQMETKLSEMQNQLFNTRALARTNQSS